MPNSVQAHLIDVAQNLAGSEQRVKTDNLRDQA